MSTSYETFCEEMTETNRRFTAVLFKLSNAVLVFFYEGEEKIKLGTLAIAMPPFNSETCISSVLLGERNSVITRILAERVANAFRGIALVSTHLTEIREAETNSKLFQVTTNLLKKAGAEGY